MCCRAFCLVSFLAGGLAPSFAPFLIPLDGVGGISSSRRTSVFFYSCLGGLAGSAAGCVIAAGRRCRRLLVRLSSMVMSSSFSLSVAYFFVSVPSVRGGERGSQRLRGTRSSP